MTYSIDKQITNALPFLNTKEKEHILGFIQSYLNQNGQTQRISKEQYNRDIETSEQEYEAGKYITHNEFLKEIEQW
jgi:hypothetical protein